MATFFVVGLQPTCCVHVGTQGFVRLRLTTPCARLWSPYRAPLTTAIQLPICVAPSGLNGMVGCYLGFHSLRSFHPRLFCVVPSGLRVGREIFFVGFLFPQGCARFTSFTLCYVVEPLQGSLGGERF